MLAPACQANTTSAMASPAPMIHLMACLRLRPGPCLRPYPRTGGMAGWHQGLHLARSSCPPESSVRPGREAPAAVKPDPAARAPEPGRAPGIAGGLPAVVMGGDITADIDMRDHAAVQFGRPLGSVDIDRSYRHVASPWG